MNSVRPSKVVTRHRDGEIHAYVLDSGAFGTLEPAAVFRPRRRDEVVESAVWPGLERVVYTTLDSVVCLTRAGDVVWTSEFEPHSDRPYGHHPGCTLSLDGRRVWVYRPDGMAGRGGADQWVMHGADSGAVLARWELDTVGHGALQRVHPADGSIYLNVGEGQDGSAILRAEVRADGEPEFVTYPWWDRCLIDLAPDGRQFMTVDHGQHDVAFHRHPSGDVLFSLPAEAFGHEPKETFVEWSGGYLTPDLAIVTVGGTDENEEDEKEWFRCHLVDVRSGTVSGEITVEAAASAYEVVPLGDGTWLTGKPDSNPVRRAHTPLAPSD
ncbi:hypothetical protein ACGF1Z_35435 [Streptomyces sp. NPDC048018]|uniref:hypothetical protein n=1 Tax=Streptomyces sp. NPDC048018 TaxID=3365499 RepID=UPI003713775D